MKAVASAQDVQRLFDTGAHFAHVKARRHPSMKPYLIGTKGRSEIIDLAKTEDQIVIAKRVMEALARDGKTVLFVGGKTEVSTLVKEAAKTAGQPYVATRWLGGTISNFPEIKKRIDRLASLQEERAAGTLAKRHTKLELVYLGREEKRLVERLDGITGLAKRPDALLVVDTKREKHAVKEARDAGIPVIGIMSSDCNLKDAVYPIVANDASREAVKLILKELAEAFVKGRTV
ncbi:MAG TPA: 30S ribosomal protein S2 [Candidatus Paceibacterota bacterium]|nr:30S ribosomal protein S2 [Candidatus Paceibacterota bacterium]